MLSYQHSYHAGNFADVIKHMALSRILQYMTQKEAPLLYLDTHAGQGLYDLSSAHALKTQEALSGIALVMEQRDKLPDLFTPWTEYILSLNPTGSLRYYPGSPWIAKRFLRESDRIVCCELHPDTYNQLIQNNKHHKTQQRIFCKNHSGLDTMNALLPPIERRGLIFMDPSYEIKTEYRTLPDRLAMIYPRFSTGIYCLWYPLVDKKRSAQLVRGLQQIPTDKHLHCVFHLTPHTTPHMPSQMTGCGLWIINPPYTLADDMHSMLKTLCTILNPGVSSFLVDTL